MHSNKTKVENDGNWPEEQTKVKTEEINDDTKVKKQEINGSRFKRHDRRRLENHTCGRSSRVGNARAKRPKNQEKCHVSKF